jgi:hypothetical protein
MLKESSMRKGRSPLIWLFAIIAIIGAAYLLPRVIEGVIAQGLGGVVKGFQKGVNKGVEGLVPGAPKTAPASVRTNLPPVHASVAAARYAQRPTPPDVDRKAEFYCTGHMTMADGDVAVFTSDGNTFWRSQGEVLDVGKRFVRLTGFQPVPIHP